MKTDYKSSDTRLVKYFEDSRNKWKIRCLTYQEEKRELQIRNRDLHRSKEKWKSECTELKNNLEEFKKKLQKLRELAKVILEE